MICAGEEGRAGLRHGREIRIDGDHAAFVERHDTRPRLGRRPQPPASDQVLQHQLDQHHDGDDRRQVSHKIADREILPPTR